MTNQTMSRAAKWTVMLGAIPFLVSIFLLAVGLRYGLLQAFAIGWPSFQVFGYAVTYNMADGDLTSPLVKSQVALHWIMLALLVAIVARVT